MRHIKQNLTPENLRRLTAKTVKQTARYFQQDNRLLQLLSNRFVLARQKQASALGLQ